MGRVVRKVLGVALLLAGLAGAGPAAANPYIVVDASSGSVLDSQEPTRPWYPASLTKLMTAYVVFKAIEAGRVDLGTPVMISARAARMAPSKMGYPAGTMVTIDNALKMLMVKSANDIAVALAEGVSGSVEGFVSEMNAHSRALGMSQSSWVNPNGLPDARQVSSARDMALLAWTIKRQFPQYASYFKIQAITDGKKVMRNHNELVLRYPGTDGMKTGFICASGFNVVASAARNGRRVITVVLGATSPHLRSQQAAGLFEDAFAKWGYGGSSMRNLPSSSYAGPTDIREDVCGKKRKNRAIESEETDYAIPQAGNGRDNPLDVVLGTRQPSSGQQQQQPRQLLTQVAIAEPVFVGPYNGDRKPGATAIAAAEPEADQAPAAAPVPPLKPGAIASSADAGATDPAISYAAAEAATPPALLPRNGAIQGNLGSVQGSTGQGSQPAALLGQIPRALANMVTPSPAVAAAAAEVSGPDPLAVVQVMPMPPPRPKRIPPLKSAKN